jgi:hypothetical protein
MLRRPVSVMKTARRVAMRTAPLLSMVAIACSSRGDSDSGQPSSPQDAVPGGSERVDAAAAAADASPGEDDAGPRDAIAPDGRPAGDAGAPADAGTTQDAQAHDAQASLDAASSADAQTSWVIAADSTGIQHIYRNGADLFEGVGGYYIIGSCTGADNSDNVTSQGSDGHTLLAPGACPGAPFQMTISAAGTTIHVSIEIGPLPADYATLSVPFDPVLEYFDTFEFDGSSYEVGCANSFSPRSGSGGTFDSIPTPCQIPGVGGVGVARVAPAPAWGEISGPLGTVRRTLQSGDVEQLVFVRHPGTHNIEPGFNPVHFGTVIPQGTMVRLVEDIQLSDPAMPAVDTFSATSPLMGHGIGRAEADGWSASTNLDSPGTLVFGPYANGFAHYPFHALFRMMVDDNTADDAVVARIEVNDYDGRAGGCGGCVIASREIRRREFSAPLAYQDFDLPFTAPGPSHRLELRTNWTGASYLREQQVEVHWPP